MLIRLASDLHLEGFLGMRMEKIEEVFLPFHPDDQYSVLVLAGDISSKPYQLAEFIKHIEHRFYRVVYVPGNHEFYQNEFNKWAQVLQDEFNKNRVYNTWTPYENVGSTVIDGVRFIAGTLWGESDTNPEYAYLIGRGIADFHVIYKSDSRLTVQDMMNMSVAHKDSIFRELNKTHEGKTVVVTHHLPTYQVVSERFKGSVLNGAFVTECMNLMTGEIVPDLWLHGHTHDQIDRIVEGGDFKLRIVANPAGYRHEWDTKFNDYFNEPKFITLG